MANDELFLILPRLPEQDTDRSLLDLANKLDKKELQIPPFQRAFVWTDSQIKSWCESVVSQKAIGCIVTYQLKGSGPVFLADGYQRLNATLRFLKNPGAYQFDFGVDQARAFADSFSITSQHRHYQDHAEAMSAFQKLNSGTALTAKEYYSGFLALSDTGPLIADGATQTIRKHETALTRYKSKKNRGADHVLDRDCYALFFQYISKTDTMDFWGVTRGVNSARVGPIVEIELSEWLLEKHIYSEQAEKLIADFDKFISEQSAELSTIRDEAGGKGLALSPTLLRWTLHLSIWRRNTDRPFQQYRELVLKLFTYLINDYRRLTSRFVLPNTEPKQDITLNIATLGKLLIICKAFQSPLYEGQKRNRLYVASGYHTSHIEPFSTNGVGPVIPEPGPRNMSRGARPIK